MGRRFAARRTPPPALSTATASNPSALEHDGSSGRLASGLRSFWLDGVLGETSEILWFQYFSVYALALGSSVGLVGILVAMSSLVSTAGSFLGASVAERTRRYRGIVIASTVLARLAFLVMAIAPWLPGHQLVIGALVTASLMKGLGSSLAVPSWTAFAAEAVPMESRTGFFAFRNFGRQAVGLVLTPLAGLLVGLTAGTEGWQVAWLGSFLIGAVAVYFFARVPASGEVEAPAKQKDEDGERWTAVRPGSVLFTFVVSALVFQLSVMLVGPFFAVYLVQELDATPFWVGMTAAASPLSATLTQAFISRFASKAGSKPMLIGSNLGIVATPVAWLFVTEPWHVCLINLMGGGLWATSQLATFNLLLAISPGRRLPTVTAVHQGAMAAAGFLGPLAGGFLIPTIGFKVILVLSAAGRFAATTLLLRLPEGQEDTREEGATSSRRRRIVYPPSDAYSRRPGTRRIGILRA